MGEITKIEKKTTHAYVVKALQEYIIDNKLMPGDRLPTEHALSEGLGISRNIVREGMQYFRSLGIIESRPRVGAVINRLMPKDPFAGYLPFLAADPKSLSEIIEMRMALECGSAALMCMHCKAEDIVYLEGLLSQLKEIGSHVEADVAFHSRLLELTNNRLIKSMTTLTVDFLTEQSDKETCVSAEQITKDHQRIIDALKDKNVENLIGAFRQHYTTYTNMGEN